MRPTLVNGVSLAANERSGPDGRPGRSAGLLLVLLALLLVLATRSADADIYRYVDEHGVLHFSNTPTHNRYRLYISETGLDIKSYFQRYDRIIKQAAEEHGVDFSLIKAVIRAESDFDQQAVSRVGAQGLMQLMPETAIDLAVTDPFDPRQNIQAGVRYLKRLLEGFKDNVPLALAAYNAGEKAVRHYGRIPPFQETRTFVDRVLGYWNDFKLHLRNN